MTFTQIVARKISEQVKYIAMAICLRVCINRMLFLNLAFGNVGYYGHVVPESPKLPEVSRPNEICV